jgi:hypothetical protein
MKKIYIIIAGAFLILLIITSMILSLEKKSTINTQKNSLFPTGIPLQENSALNQTTNSSSTNIENNSGNLPIDISTITPLETKDFKLQYSSKLNKIVVEKKTPQAENQFANWATQNQLPQLVKNPDLTLIVDQGKNPDDFNPIIEFLNIFLNFGQGTSTSTQNQSSNLNSPSSTVQPNQLPNQNPPSGLTYYAQCDGFGNIPLPSGCNLCQAGCGPTTVAMIAASYLGSSYNPKTIVDIYQSKGYSLGCDGSGYSEAKNILQELGLKTTDYLVFGYESADQVVPELKKYLAGGWTFFTLASYCNGGCGHFFWITDIDSQGNIWAYDPYYGRYEIPYNENSRYPYPSYRLAFGVKKI